MLARRTAQGLLTNQDRQHAVGHDNRCSDLVKRFSQADRTRSLLRVSNHCATGFHHFRQPRHDQALT
jgi:hypothetical protein